MVAGKTLNELVGAVPRPDRLFHFTDSNGLIGILNKRTLWATLATSLNDVSEIQHGLGRARKLLESNAADAPSSFLKKIEHYLDPANAFPLGTWHLHTFLISLCARIDRSVHWLHYGRSGTGFAIGFDANGLEKSPFVLVPVIYDEQAQDQLL